MAAWANRVRVPLGRERRTIAGPVRAAAWVIAAWALAAAGLIGPASGAPGDEAAVEPTYDGRTLDQWKRLSVNDLCPETRAEAMRAFAAFGRAGRGDEAIAAIKSALEPPQEGQVITAAYDALTRLGPPAFPLLLEGLKSEQAKTRQIVVKVLGSYSPSREPTERVVPDEVFSALIRATEDPDPSVRAQACCSLGYLHSHGAGKEHVDEIVAALVKCLGDETRVGNISGYYPSSVQGEACRALGRLGAEAAPAIPSLIEVVKREPKPQEGQEKPPYPGWLSIGQRMAIEALGDIGKPAQAAVPVLEALNQKRSFSSEVNRALDKIQGRGRARPSFRVPAGSQQPPQAVTPNPSR